jgi:hypothetical protein
MDLTHMHAYISGNYTPVEIFIQSPLTRDILIVRALALALALTLYLLHLHFTGIVVIGLLVRCVCESPGHDKPLLNC